MPFLRRFHRRSLLLLAAWPVAGSLRAAPAAAGGALQPMLAADAPPGLDPTGWLVSEKLDGVRALWDGAALRFRSGRPIAAPRWFTGRLPDRPLDGELWMGRGTFEALSGTVRRLDPDDAAWRTVRYEAFDLPGGSAPFGERAAALQRVVRQASLPFLHAVEQRTLTGPAALQRHLDEVVRAGGEGLMLHRADARWCPGRSAAVLKLKPLQDAEAVVVAHEPGQGRHAGRLGALRVQTDAGVRFRLGTGLSDAQRDDPPPVGSVVTYTYRGRTDDGVPRFASFLRARGAE